VTRSCGNPNGEMRRSQLEALTRRDPHAPRVALLHFLDTMLVVDPCTFPERLRKAGFADVQVDVLKPYAFRFRARKAAITFPARDEVLGV